MERCKDNRSRGLPGSYPFVCGNTAKDCGIALYGVLEGKSSTMLYEQFGELKYQYRNRQFWCRGYYVDTVGKNESRIAEYVRNQLKEDEMGDQLRIPSASPFTGGK